VFTAETILGSRSIEDIRRFDVIQLEEHMKHPRLVFESIWQHKLYAWPRKYIFNKIYIEIYDHYCWQRNLWLEDAWYQELIASQKCIRTIISILSIINIYHFSMIVAILSDSFKSEDNVNCLNDYASSHFEWHNIL